MVTEIHKRDCGYCGGVARYGPYSLPGYGSDWYLCKHCVETNGDFAPNPEAVDLTNRKLSMKVEISGMTVAAYPGSGEL